MKLKRILAGIIACTMVATAMGVTAFAADTEPTDVVTTTETEILAGDINNDEVVNMQDALILSRYLVSGNEEAKANFARLMDLNLDAVRDENGYIGISSIINVLKEVVKTPPVTDTTPVDTDETTVDTDETTVDTDETTVDTDETTVDTDETTVDTDETTVDTDETTVDTDETTVDTEAPVDKADYDAAVEAYNAMQDAFDVDGKYAGYPDAITADVLSAIDAADAAIADLADDATQEDIDAATALINAAVAEINAALNVAVDAELDDTYAAALGKTLNTVEFKKYYKGSQDALLAAIAAANALPANATVDAKLAAIDALNAAIAGLITPEDALAIRYDELVALVATANEIEQGNYTDASYNALCDAIIDAEGVIDDVEFGVIADKEALEAIDTAISALEEAIDGLETDAEKLVAAADALKVNLANAENYKQYSKDLVAAIAVPKTYFRNGALVSGVTLTAVNEANFDIELALEAVIEDLMENGFDEFKDGDVVVVEAVEEIIPQIHAAVATGFFTYEDIFNAAGLKLTEANIEALAALEDAEEIETFYFNLLKGDLTTAEKVAIFEAYRAAVDAAYADAIANYATEFAAAEAIVEAEDAANADDEDELEPIYVDISALKGLLEHLIDEGEDTTRLSAIGRIGALRATVDLLVTVEDLEASEAFGILEGKVATYFEFDTEDTDKITAIAEKYADLYTVAEATALIADAQAKFDALDVDTMSEMEEVLKAMSFKYITANKAEVAVPTLEAKLAVYTPFITAVNALTGTEDLAILEAYVAELDAIAGGERIAVEKLEVLNALGKVVDVSGMTYIQVENLNKAKLTLVSGRTVTVAFTWEEIDGDKYTATITGSDYSAPATPVEVEA